MTQANRTILSYQAEDDLANILRYTIRNFGVSLGEKYKQLLIDAFKEIQEKPSSGKKNRPVPESSYDFRYLRAGKHHILYFLQNDEVKILRILHTSMDFLSHLP